MMRNHFIWLALVLPAFAKRPWQAYVLGPPSTQLSPISINGDGSNGVQVANMGFRLTRESNGGLDRWPEGTKVSASSTHAPNPRTYDATNAIDGDGGTYWNDDTIGLGPDVLTITSPTPINFPGISIQSHLDGCVADLFVETSNDGATWTQQATLTDNEALLVSLPFPAPVNATGIRITVTKNRDGGKGIFTRIAEVTPSLTNGIPFVDVDFGKVVAGHLHLAISAASNPPPQLRLAFSEARRYLGFGSDYSRSDYGASPTHTDDHVPSVSGETWIDVAGCQFDGTVCADGLRAFRYVRIFLDQTPGAESHSSRTGWVQIGSVSLDFTPFLGTPDTYRGYFLSNDDLLNRIWYASVYTVELNTDSFYLNSTDPRGAWSASLDGKRVLFDGAKRDRDPYAGDVAVQMLVDFVARADGEGARNVLEDLAAHQRDDGWIPPASISNYGLPLFDYPAWWARAVADYYVYTADNDFAQRMWPMMKKLIDGWYPSVAASDGMLDKSGTYGGYGDYAFLPRQGKMTYYSANYVLALRSAGQLASALGHAQEAAQWPARANAVAQAIANSAWDDAAKAWLDGPNAQCHSQDATAFATLAGVGGSSRAAQSLAYLTQKNSRPWGNTMADNNCLGDGTSDRVYAFLNYPEVLARFSINDDAAALDQIRRTWGWMINQDPGNTTWEGVGAGGDIANYEGPFTSLAHGWGAGAAPALSNEVLGIKPTAPGFATYSIIPHVGNLEWVEGTMPTPHGGLNVSWQRTDSEFVLAVEAPPSTIGRVAIPTDGKDMVVSIDSTIVWDGHGPVQGALTSSDGRYVYVDSVAPGSHSIKATSSAVKSTSGFI